MYILTPLIPNISGVICYICRGERRLGGVEKIASGKLVYLDAPKADVIDEAFFAKEYQISFSLFTHTCWTRTPYDHKDVKISIRPNPKT